MRIRLASVPVTMADQDKALRFYTEKLGFEKRRDIPMGGARFLTLVAAEDPDGPELMLEPAGDHPATKTWREALFSEGIPVTAFRVEDIAAEQKRLAGLGVEFVSGPTDAGDSVMAVLDDPCGNLIMIYEARP